jgi:ABC-2 type transport system ATP-binding protein
MVNSKIISVRDLKKYFGEVKAVNGISFDVYKGEILGLLGPNGAGKTTTIKLLLGLLEPLEGEISIFGLNPEREEVQMKKRIGYSAEEPLIFKSLTPKDLFNFIASIRQLDPKNATERVREYLESLEAKEYYDQMITSLSHGNKQKIQIIASILHEPDLLILDEPLSGLDAKSVRVFREILDLHIEKGGAVLFSTHIMEIAENLCDRIAIINKGKFVGIGTIDELRQQADKLGASLEDVFLRLTEQDSSVKNIVKKLRKSYKKKIEEAT